MRTGILADIHGNAVALEAVLADGERRGVERWISLGDVVGYGPEPHVCLRRLRELEIPSVLGNHEARTLDLPTGAFNKLADEAIAYTREILTAEDRAQLRSFERTIRWGDEAEFCHGSPADRDAYLLLRQQFDDVARAQRTWLVFFGHTHQQVLFDGVELRLEPTEIALDRHRHYVVNPGSVGQPRDGDPRAGYAILDLELGRLQLRRVDYDIEAQIARVERAGLPAYLGERLRSGH